MTYVADDHPEAHAEYLQAVAFYDGKRVGLGDELIDRFEDAIREILSDPESWPQVPDWNGKPTPNLSHNHQEATISANSRRRPV